MAFIEVHLDGEFYGQRVRELIPSLPLFGMEGISQEATDEATRIYEGSVPLYVNVDHVNYVEKLGTQTVLIINKNKYILAETYEETVTLIQNATTLTMRTHKTYDEETDTTTQHTTFKEGPSAHQYT